MAKGSSKGGGGGANNALLNIENTNGYDITTANGEKMQFFIRDNGKGTTFFRRDLSDMLEPTPAGMTEKQMIQAIKDNGGTVKKIPAKQLEAMELKRLADRKKTDAFLNQAYVNDTTMKKGSKTNRKNRAFNRRQSRR